MNGLLSCQRIIKCPFDIAMHSKALLVDADLSASLLLLEDVPARTELTYVDDRLLNEATLLDASVRATANLVPLISDGGIGIEGSLSRLLLCPLHLLLRLFECWVLGVPQF